jgi:hypothetical protein
MELKFDETNHRYTLDGKTILSVTQYLKLGGFINGDFYTEEGRKKGKAIHALVEYYVKGELDSTSIHPLIIPYFEGFKAFLKETEFKVLSSEDIVFDEIYNYAGKVDLVGRWKQFPGIINLDIKTGSIPEFTPLQLAAYQIKYGGHRFCLQLKPNATYNLSKEYTDPNDIKIFRAIVATVNWKIQHGLIDIEKELNE